MCFILINAIQANVLTELTWLICSSDVTMLDCNCWHFSYNQSFVITSSQVTILNHTISVALFFSKLSKYSIKWTLEYKVSKETKIIT